MTQEEMNKRSGGIFNMLPNAFKMEDDMNLVDIHDTFTKKFANKIADYEDSAAYAYVTTMAEELTRRGEDLTKYELVFIESENPEIVAEEDSMKMVARRRLQLRKIA